MRIARQAMQTQDFIPMAENQVVANPVEDPGLFHVQQVAANIIGNAYSSYVYVRNEQASTGIRKLLETCATKVEDLSELHEDDVIIVHRRPTPESSHLHGFFAIVEEMGDPRSLLTLIEVCAEPRSIEDNETLFRMPTKRFPEMALNRSWGYKSNEQLEYFIKRNEMFKLKINRYDHKTAVDNLVARLKRERVVGFYGATFGCNNFMYEVLKSIKEAAE
jgi:hypothetical protein